MENTGFSIFRCFLWTDPSKTHLSIVDSEEDLVKGLPSEESKLGPNDMWLNLLIWVSHSDNCPKQRSLRYCKWGLLVYVLVFDDYMMESSWIREIQLLILVMLSQPTYNYCSDIRWTHTTHPKNLDRLSVFLYDIIVKAPGFCMFKLLKVPCTILKRWLGS